MDLSEYLARIVIVVIHWYYSWILLFALPFWQLAQLLLIPWELVLREGSSRSDEVLQVLCLSVWCLQQYDLTYIFLAAPRTIAIVYLVWESLGNSGAYILGATSNHLIGFKAEAVRRNLSGIENSANASCLVTSWTLEDNFYCHFPTPPVISYCILNNHP